MSRVIDKFKDKNILIWGYGREGQSTEEFFKRNSIAKKVDIYEGGIDGIDESAYDYIFKSPGIAVECLSDKYTSQTELFLEEHRDRVIGITGTKGKSTTSSMLYEVLDKATDKKSFLMGNIGKPCLDYFEEVTEDSIVVFEMSCHQLAHLKVSPHIAVFLNLFEEHLDYYGTMDKYFNAKKNITLNQVEGDYVFFGSNVPHIDTKATATIIDKAEDIELGILGEHNHLNATFVKHIAMKVFGCQEEAVLKAIAEFAGLPHRLEYVGEIDGVRFYDDSISTIPEATIQAIESIDNVKTVLVGGMDRNIDYTVLEEYIHNTPDILFICAYDSGKRIYDMCKDAPNCIYVEDLAQSVAKAKEVTEKGSACVLSPASASYGFFKNFEDRGDRFKEYVLG